MTRHPVKFQRGLYILTTSLVLSRFHMFFLMTCSEQRFIHFLYTMCNVDQHRYNFVSNNRLVALYPFFKLSEYAFFGWILRLRCWNNIWPLSFLMCFKIMPVIITVGQHQGCTSQNMIKYYNGLICIQQNWQCIAENGSLYEYYLINGLRVPLRCFLNFSHGCPTGAMAHWVYTFKSISHEPTPFDKYN